MNLSSVIVLIEEKQSMMIVDRIKSIEGCDVPLIDRNKLIVTIEANGAETEMATMKQIESISGVLSATMVYAYSEHELEAERDKVELSPDFPDWLNKQDFQVKDIPYSGRLKF